MQRLSFAELPGVVNNSYPVGTELKYSCRPGYILVPGRSPVVTCLANSTWSVDPEFCFGQCGPNQRLHHVVHDTNLIGGFTTNREVICSALNTAGNSAEPEGGGPGFDTRIGIPAIAIAFAISVIIIVYIRKYQKKKCSYSVNRDSSKHQITMEHDFHMNESKRNLIFKAPGQGKWRRAARGQSRDVRARAAMGGAARGAAGNAGAAAGARALVPLAPPAQPAPDSERPAATQAPPPAGSPVGRRRGRLLSQSCGLGLRGDIVLGPLRRRFHLATLPTGPAMVSAPRCPPGARGLLALLLLLLPPLPGARGTCDSPPRLSFAELPGAVNNSYPVDTKLKYSCRPGYILGSGKSPFVTCLANSTWSADPEFCVGRPCKSLELENGRVHLTDIRFGATATFSCNEGSRLIGTTSAKCVVAGTGVDWDKELPLCQAIPCLPPPDITHGSHTGQGEQEFSFGSAVIYKCDQGFSLIGNASIHCTTKDNNGEWSGPAPECKVVRCPEPEVKNGKKQSGFGLDYSYGNVVIFECDSGYTLTGSSSVKCEANNSWVPSLPTCLRTCNSPPWLNFAELPGAVNDPYLVGTKLKYSCRPGYILGSGKSPFVTCLANSTWSVDPEFCVGRPCKPLELENGRVDLTDLRFGATATFSCNEGYRLIGTTSAKCVVAGTGVDWDKELPLCQAIPCLPPPDITHGSHTGQGEEFFFGSAVIYKCDQGFSLIGNASIHCTTKDNNGEWSGPAPECKVVKCPEPEVKNGKKQSGFGPNYSYGNIVIFECDSGYTLNSSSSVKCEANNSWVPSLPTCLRVTYTTTTTTSSPGGTTDTSGSNAGIMIAIGKMPVILAVLITNLFIRQ
ncbi:complement receptor type 2-like [Gopherus evgoodei]|uniref:complement receptor type 2-like n=1 Tax=Gopherus evgoodei TaxID=1825980 RepID=UPI0011CF0CE6|nr:complement receptor type 2-like [Gopherus evgoodei]